jgi:membrane associated rhomboid family serine protease
MLEDRDYMRQPVYYRPRVSFTVVLLVVNAIAFLAECVTCGYPPLFSTGNYFALSVEGLKHGFVWQLLTYQFMHGGLLHILVNCWAIYVFGRAIEETLGGGKFLILFLTSGVIGGIFQELAALPWPEYFGGPVVGASAGAFGLVAAYAILFPERELTMLLFFVVPIRLSAKALLILSAVLAVLGIAWGIAFPISNIANAAHLGGMLTGVVFIRQFVQGRWSPWQSSSRRTPSSESESDLSTDKFLQKEVDPILDKISTQGIQSLTAREREILEKARSKMGKH